ncbi:MAG TPA: hypothetical protein VLJ59_00490 [Mycobacteriales bacterium]|nr:hypothetical protein [Mycobacteriales bacterium]
MGVIVVALVLGLRLFPRLKAAQDLIDDVRQAFTPDRIAGDRGGINMVSTVVDLAQPVVNARGGAAAEVPRLVEFVSTQTGLPPGDVLALLQKEFPHTTGLLIALPLSDVTTELPKLISFLATTLKLSQSQVMAAIRSNFPHLNQAITNLPAVTKNFDAVPDISKLTRFDGSPVRTLPQVRDYLSGDVVNALETQQKNFRGLDSKGGVLFLAPLLLILGIIVIIFGTAMAFGASKGIPHEVSALGWVLVTVVGILVVALVRALSLYPRLGGGQELLDGVRPAFDPDRVAGDKASVAFISTAVDTLDPVLTAQGGAAAEVPKLVAFVSTQTGLPQADVLALLQKEFPHTTGLLTALPLSAVSEEIPKLVAFLANTLKIGQSQVLSAIRTNFPNLYQAITTLPAVTGGWSSVPGIPRLTRFSGAQVISVKQLRDYFKDDVVPLVERQRANFETVDRTWPRLTVFPPLLVVVGVLVTVYGLINFGIAAAG